MRQGRAKYLFPGNNTARGFISHYRDGILGMEQVFIIKGGPGVGKSTLMRKIGIAMLERGYDVEFWQCSADNDSLDGVLIPAILTAIIDGTPPHGIDPRYPGAVEEIVDLGANWNKAMLKRNKREIITLTDKISQHFRICYDKLAQAGRIMEANMEEVAATIDRAALQETIQQLIETVYHSRQNCCRHLFSSAITPRGNISFTDSLSRTVSRRWLLYGPSGCGKEDILDELAKEAQKRGHYAEIFHPALLPEQIELLLLPHLDSAIMDVGEKIPANIGDNDYLIDCASLSGKEENGSALTVSSMIKEATEEIAKAKDLHDQLEQYYVQAMDFNKVDAAGAGLFNRILAICAEKESAETR